MGEIRSAREGILRAQFFDDQGVGQEGQVCQTENAHGFNDFSGLGFGCVGLGRCGFLPGFLWWIPKSRLGHAGFRKRIQRAKIVIPQPFDNESDFRRGCGGWLLPGFPGEEASR